MAKAKTNLVKDLKQNFGEAICAARRAASSLDVSSRHHWEQEARAWDARARQRLSELRGILRDSSRFMLHIAPKDVEVDRRKQPVLLDPGEIEFSRGGGRWPVLIVGVGPEEKRYPLHRMSGIKCLEEIRDGGS